MSNPIHISPPSQLAIRAKCFHPSGTYVEFPIEDVETSIPARFEKIARRYPARTAVKADRKQLTYAELDLASNRLAQAILARRGERAEPIGFLFTKSAGFVVALMAILKAGKIAAPMDPALPLVRLSLMFEDMQAPVLLTDHDSFAIANRVAGPDRCLDIAALQSNTGDQNPRLALSPDGLACLFYTSGSTGLPKGVMENHRNLLHLVMRDTNDYHICAEDKLAFVASAGRDIFRAVLNGATVYPIDIRREGFVGLCRRLMEDEITIYNSVTSAFRNFAGTLTGRERFPHLRLLMVTGETVYRSDFELYKRFFSADACVFVNRYGPNEASGLISQYLMDKLSVVTGATVPVGYPAKDKEIRLIDDSGVPAGIGRPGEIAVTSRYLSPGYWRQSERTGMVFQSGSSDYATRLYRTGDIGVMDPDGRLTHLGREDFQVKIRGNKVEMAAVETALLNLEAIGEAAVIAHDDTTGDKRLVAYIVAKQVPVPTTNELRDALAATLPEYMVPATFVFLDKLPVTGIGKVDRKSLTDPGHVRPRLNESYQAPINPIETRLARIWSEVLALEDVGVNDNFLDLGGHSLAAMRVVSQVLSEFQLEIPLTSLFAAPTVAEMAKVIERHQENRITTEDLDRLLTEVEAMQEEEATRLVDKRR